MIKTKWFIYTVIVGLIPLIVRLCIFMVVVKKDISLLLDPLDFTILGLVINITNINELEGRQKINDLWKTRCIGISIIFIVIYAVFFALSIVCSINESLFDKRSILISSILLSSASVIYGFSIFDRLNKIERSIN